jgi:hypothetical protein
VHTDLRRALAVGFVLLLSYVLQPAVARADDPSASDSLAVGADSLAAVEEESIPEPTVLDGITEQMTALQTDVDRLKRFKLSGYVQVRWDASEADFDTVKVSGSPSNVVPFNVERFYIRRGRLKLTYDAAPWGEFVFSMDGAQDRIVKIIDVYAALFDPWTVEHHHQFWAGQFNTPFGYEIERSSSVRELPERSRAENILFPGERDRGVQLRDQWGTHLETTLSVINGGAIGNAEFPNTDPTAGKDLLGRARVLLGFLDFGVSGYTGHATTPLTGPDVETDRDRFGAEAQYYYALPHMGGGSLKGEYYSGHNVNADSVSTLVTGASTANPVRLLAPGADPSHLATDFNGGYVMWVQNLGEHLQVAGRYDFWDPNVDVDHDQFHRWGFGVNAFYQGQVRVTLAYELPTTDKAVAGGYADPSDNMWTAQFQFMF